MDLALSNPDYVQLGNTFPPKILLTVFPLKVQENPPDDYCYIGVNGVIEDLGRFTLRFPSHPFSDPVDEPRGQPKSEYIYGHW